MQNQKTQKKSIVRAVDPVATLCLLALVTAFTLAGLIISTPLPALGAASTQADNYRPELPKALAKPEIEYHHQAAELSESIRAMATQLFENLLEPDPELGYLADGIAVTSFVDLKKLSRTSSFGRYLAEQLMTEFQQQGYTIIEVRKSNAILVQEKRGEYGLSRDLKEISPAVAARTMITGTYTLAGDHILVNAKILDNKDSTLLSSATVLFPKTTLVNQLLADSVSASPRKTEVTYMKRLDPSPQNLN